MKREVKIMIKLLFFGRFSDVAAAQDIALPQGVSTSDDLVTYLSGENPALAAQFARAGNRIAVNKDMVAVPVVIMDGDEIAFMSALSGG